MDMWKHRMIIRKGLKHKNSHKPCQDSVTILETPEALVAVLADGLGSLDHSSIASNAAIKKVELMLSQIDCKSVLEWDLLYLKGQILGACKDKIVKSANELGISISKMDCTLAFIYIAKISNIAIVGCIGDSAICIMHDDRADLLCMASDSYANATRTVMSANAVDSFAIKKYDLLEEKIAGFIITSDGLENEIYIEKSGSVKHGAELYFNSVSMDYSMSEAVINNRIDEITASYEYGFDDDISLAVLSRINYKIKLPADATWLCHCGARNELQYTLCHNCNRDFLQIYEDIDLQKHGGKTKTFEWLNKHPDNELSLLKERKGIKTPKIDSQEQVPTNNADLSNLAGSKEKQPIEGGNQTMFNSDGKSLIAGKGSSPIGFKVKRVLVGVVACIVCFLAGIGSLFCYQLLQPSNSETIASKQFMTIEDNLNDLSNKMDTIESALVNIGEDNPSGSDRDRTGYIPISERLYAFRFTNGKLFVGDIINDLPNGYGVIFENGVIQVGYLNDGVRNGKFVLIDNKGNTSEYLFENDIIKNDNNAINKNTNESSDNRVISSQADEIKTFVVDTSPLNVRERATVNSAKITEIVAGDVVYSYGEESIDEEQRSWLKITTDNGYMGWVLLSALSEKF